MNMGQVTQFKKFYKLFLDNIFNIKTTAVWYKDIHYEESHFYKHHTRIVCPETPEHSDMIERLNKDDILNIEIDNDTLQKILKMDSDYYSKDRIKFNEFHISSEFRMEHRWTDTPSVNISFRIDRKVKILEIEIAFTVDDRNDGLPDWTYISSIWKYWFKPVSDESKENNDRYVKMINFIEEVL